MKEIAVVESVMGKEAVVSVKRSTACGDSCATCSMQCNVRGNKIVVNNPVNAMAGDVVAIEMETKKVLKSAFLVYILPLIAFFAGYFAAEYKTASDVKALIGGLLGFFVTFVILYFWDKSHKDKFRITITEILEKRI